MNQIATITMIGQWPDGVPLHINNLKWTLSSIKHKIYIITTPEIKTQYQNEFPDVIFIENNSKPKNLFINFWQDFPSIAKQISCEFFLFMEQDIWFYKQIKELPDNQIINYFSLSKYHAMTVNKKVYHPRIWEGANLISNNLIQKAIENNISFTFTKKYFFEEERAYWEEKLGGSIGMNEFGIPDTMDELSYYLPMKHNTQAILENKALHIRGPETVHRYFPDILNATNDNQIDKIKNKIPYIDPYVALAAFYLNENYSNVKNYNLQNMRNENKKMFKLLETTSKEWMGDKSNRLITLLESF